jgi:5'-3' exoribonuclease 2
LSVAEERQNQNAKRRKLQADTGPSVALQLTAAPTAPPIPSVHPSLPRRPTYDFAATADSIGLGAPPTLESIQNASTATQALAGSNHDIVANRRAIRLANLSAAEILRAELSRNSVQQSPPERDLSLPVKPSVAVSTSSLPPTSTSVDAVRMSTPAAGPQRSTVAAETSVSTNVAESKDQDTANESELDIFQPDNAISASEIITESLDKSSGPDEDQVVIGVKRKLEDDTDDLDTDDQDTAPASNPYEMTVNPDGTVEQEDRVKLVTCASQYKNADGA